ncbi:hypothetical protein SELMODRAFT_414949 [Selaginella moellendorffii]|uniref:Uncharacterized protein n=1 Tax=Selaginella moellendorffii TaxID=88036 RepID=D8RU39_SELML|nr:hypothetical protein SELMODRAFT_414949 [Selaginella moellendorffii]
MNDPPTIAAGGIYRGFARCSTTPSDDLVNVSEVFQSYVSRDPAPKKRRAATGDPEAHMKIVTQISKLLKKRDIRVDKTRRTQSCRGGIRALYSFNSIESWCGRVAKSSGSCAWPVKDHALVNFGDITMAASKAKAVLEAFQQDASCVTEYHTKVFDLCKKALGVVEESRHHQ